ncbi:histidinol-phosphate transaminase [Herbiconiux sp. L3-i23]|uniref:histidinol-phosphate transaminase n=1 Tax=Herbiconiux sp. L3-i23 TaxID=2905871 RepID=UPI002050AB66|nr:histidinol-phosphate transaminase [Herbiconiux sp. L3-i23]BDI24180.1 putative phenylalanine aminotransferase [Herbiconiux sp. L3-i23]
MPEQVPPPVRLRPEIAALPAYKQGKPAAAGGYKLSSNENPFPPHAAVLAAMNEASDINRYPDASAFALREALAARFGVTADEVHVGAGSVALITQFITAAAGHGDEVIHPWRSFEAYPGQVTVAGATAVPVPLRPDGGHDLDAMAAAVNDRTRVVLVCTPNNPTGVVVTAAEFEEFMRRIPGDLLVLLDEAYAEFVRDDAAVDGATLFGRYPNLVVLRTFSKAWGLAGLRLGYAVGPEHVLDAARAAALPLSVTGQAQAAGLAALSHETDLFARVDHIVARRDAVLAGLRAVGLAVPESHGNFVWLGLGEHTAAAARILEEHAIVARVFAGEGVRISIGEAESVDELLRAGEEIVRNLPGAVEASR